MNPRRTVTYDKTRGNVALAKLCVALGVDCDGKRPDHELLEDLAEAAQNAASVAANDHRKLVKEIRILCDRILDLRTTRPPSEPPQ